MDNPNLPSRAGGHQSPRRMLRLRDVTSTCGLSRSAIYRGVEENTFPRPVRIGRRAVAWNSDEIQAWIEARLATRGERA